MALNKELLIELGDWIIGLRKCVVQFVPSNKEANKQLVIIC